MKRVLVCGGREFDNWNRLVSAMERNGVFPINTVAIIQGGAKGADFLAKTWAKSVGIPVDEYPADWKTHGKAAGGIRNQKMLDEGKPDLVIAFPGGAGTADMVRRAEKAGVPVTKA